MPTPELGIPYWADMERGLLGVSVLAPLATCILYRVPYLFFQHVKELVAVAG